MKSDAAVLSATADQLERLARLLRDRPEAVERALARLDGTKPGMPDLVYLSQEGRRVFLEDTAAALGINLDDLRILEYVVTVVNHVS